MLTMTVMSAAMRRLRREVIETSRRWAALAPTGGVSRLSPKKPSVPPQYVLALPAPLPRSSPAPTTTRPSVPRRADGDGARLERAPPSPSAVSSRSRHTTASEVIKSESIGKGVQVRVRMRVSMAPTGQPIVFWLRAVVDSAAADEDGYLHVTYSYVSSKLPRTARVTPSAIRLHDVPLADARRTAASTGSSTVIASSDRSARPPQQNKVAPRPTIAGKKLPLLKKFEKEMKSRSRAI